MSSLTRACFIPKPKYLGFYEPFRRNINRLVGCSPSEQIAATSGMAGAASGVVGGRSFAECTGSFQFLFIVSLSWKSFIPCESTYASVFPGITRRHSTSLPIIMACSVNHLESREVAWLGSWN